MNLKKRYYLLMFSVFIYAFLMDTIFLSTIGELNLSNVTWVIVIQSFVYIIVNGLIARQIFQPIDNYIQNTDNLDKLLSRIYRLAILSCMWIVFLGLLYSAINFTMILLEFPELVETFFLKLYWGIGLIFFYCIFPGFYIFFLSSNFTMRLKLYFSKINNVQFSSENGKIWKKLSLIYFAILPVFVMILLDMFVWGSTKNSFNSILVMDMVLGSVIAFMIIYLVTNGINQSVILLLDAYQNVHRGDFSVRAPVVTNDEIGILSANFNEMVGGLQERELIRDTFGKYVPKTVADAILKNNIDLADEVRLATILFSDIEGYSTIVENMEPREVIQMSNEYFSFLVDVITHHKGVVNRFIGDSVFAIFNAPLRDDEHAQNAIRAAIEIQRLAKDKCFGVDQVPLNTRIGINTGVIVVGNIGSRERLQYSAIGDEVNIAARLEQLNKEYGTRILVGENTYELTKAEFCFEEIGHVELKGKQQSVCVYKPQIETDDENLKDG